MPKPHPQPDSNRPPSASASWALTVHRAWQQLNRCYIKAKARLYYRSLFGHLGSSCSIDTPLLLHGPECFHFGNRVRVRYGARLEAVVQYGNQKFSPIISIGDDCSFEQGLHLVCAEKITIGQKVAVTEFVGIFDIWHGYEQPHSAIVDQEIQTAPITIGDHTLIGIGAVIQPGVSIGRHCIIGANSVVTRNLGDYSVAVGVPAKVIRQFDPTTGRWCSIA